MAIINNAKREINAKIVYYGCEGAGKGTSLRYLYERIKPSLRGELKTLPGSGGSLLFFDFCPFEQPVFGGYRIRFHIYTLPGRVANPASWKMTLKGADGVVLVVDGADASPAGRQSMGNLRDYLASYGMSLHDIPAILQINKTDRNGTMDPTATAANLELGHLPVCLSSALNGTGVLESFSALSRRVMERVGAESSLQADPTPLPPSSVDVPGDMEPSAPVGGAVGVMTGQIAAPPCNDEDTTPESPEAGAEDGSGLKVTLSEEAVALVDGSVRVPLTISLHGQERRFMLKVAVEPAGETP